MKFQPKKQFQIKRMFGLAAPIASAAEQDTKEYLEDLLGAQTRGRIDRLSAMSYDDANNMIVALGGTAFPFMSRSKRTENYRKQVAGVKTIETDAHLKLIEELAGMRGWTAESLVKFCRRNIKKDSPTTTEDGNKIVEGLKAMNRREGLLKFSPTTKVQSPKTTAEPSFRRVA